MPHLVQESLEFPVVRAALWFWRPWGVAGDLHPIIVRSSYTASPSASHSPARSMTAQDCQDQLTRLGMDLVSGLTFLVWHPELGGTQRRGCQTCGPMEHACVVAGTLQTPSYPHLGSSG